MKIVCRLKRTFVPEGLKFAWQYVTKDGNGQTIYPTNAGDFTWRELMELKKRHKDVNFQVARKS